MPVEMIVCLAITTVTLQHKNKNFIEIHKVMKNRSGLFIGVGRLFSGGALFLKKVDDLFYSCPPTLPRRAEIFF